jgi:hypothetical protein
MGPSCAVLGGALLKYNFGGGFLAVGNIGLGDLSRVGVLLNGGGGQVHGRRWYQECMEKAAWRNNVDSVS